MFTKVRTRIAPSPTGMMHLGTARTAIYCWAVARHFGGEFLLRIEDTDRERSTPEATQVILDAMKWLNLDYDNKEVVYQMNRLPRYKEVVDQLLAKGLAYKCYATKEELDEMREAQKARGEKPRYDGRWRPENCVGKPIPEGVTPVIRFRNPDDGVVTWEDGVYGEITVANSELDDLVIMRGDGIPTYNFAVVIDDHDMQISHVIRGDDHIANTPKQLMVYEALGWEAPEFGHMTLIINSETGKKLSKRDTNTLQFIEDYRKKGYLPEAVFNFIALLGWNPGGEDEIFSREELIKLFDENRLSKSPAAFDQKKLDWMSNDYIKNADFDKVFALCKPFLEEAGRLTDKAEKLVELYKPQMTAAEEIVPLTDLFFEDFPELTEAEKEVMAGETVPTVLKAFKAKLEAMSDDEFVVENIFPQIKAVQKETGIKGKNLFMPIRIAVSGEMHGPELPDTIFLLGREKSIKHIDQVLATL